MSKLPTFLHIPSPSLKAAYPPPTNNKAGSGQGRDNNSSSNNHWVKVHQSQLSSRLDETLPLPVDFSVFLNQPINPFMDSNSNTQTRTTMYVQDSGVVMISTSSLPRQQPNSSSSSSKNSTAKSSRESSTSRTKPAQSSSNNGGGGSGGGDEMDDDWEVVYPDN